MKMKMKLIGNVTIFLEFASSGRGDTITNNNSFAFTEHDRTIHAIPFVGRAFANDCNDFLRDDTCGITIRCQSARQQARQRRAQLLLLEQNRPGYY
jgi:hypothetical protein